MTRKTSRTRFWTTLAIINVAAMVYPLNLYVQAESNEARLVAAMIVLGVGFVLAITDTVSAIVTYMQ